MTASRPLGPLLPSHKPAPTPTPTTLRGRFVTLLPTSPTHAPALFPLLSGPSAAPLWDYMFSGPFTPEDLPAFTTYMQSCSTSTDPLFFTIVLNATNSPVGMLSLMRHDPAHGVVEVGHIMYGPTLQRTPGATEAMYLLSRYVFEELGYRRYEWKCNDLNAPSRRAAGRYGFAYEGTFRQHMVVKGRNRDTWWASMVDGEWPKVKGGFERWLEMGNFDEEGRQVKTLEECRKEAAESFT